MALQGVHPSQYAPSPPLHPQFAYSYAPRAQPAPALYILGAMALMAALATLTLAAGLLVILA